ncbi:MAG: phosphoribosyltransferase family protein [bacterium]|nr:phosphoribosyltransferase family protein [bacterium]
MKLKEFLLDTLFQPHCKTCATPLTGPAKRYTICASCLDAIQIETTLCCVICRARLADDTRVCHSSAPLRLAAVGRYSDERLRSLVTRIKYRRHTSAMSALAVLIDRYLGNLSFDFTNYHVIPIPLHVERERKRGFNQSMLIAEIIAERLHLPLLKNELIKTKSTPPQAKTENLKERVKNLSGCFTVLQPKDVAGKKILLVDDVCTSGTTLIEAAQTLKQAKARNIIGFVIAKTG